MTKYLNQALHQYHPIFNQNLKRLNQLAGNLALDINFTTQIENRLRLKVNQLGLDFDDLEPVEVYYALHHKMLHDEQQFLQSINYDLNNNQQDWINSLVDYLNDLIVQLDPVLSIKSKWLKETIIALKPHRTLKLLGYRSYLSMIKREPLENIILSLQLNESKNWLIKFNNAFHNLKSNDFDQSPIKIFRATKLNFKTKNNGFLVANFWRGQIGLINLDNYSRYQSGLISLIIYQVVEMVERWLKLNYLLNNFKFRSDFIKLYTNLSSNLDSQLNLINKNWLKKTNRFDDFLFQQLNFNRSLEFSSNKYGSFFQYWDQTDYLLAVKKNQLISFNLADLALDSLLGYDYDFRNLNQATDNLKKQLVLSYFKNISNQDYFQMLMQINNQSYVNQMLCLVN
jgi:hypothetical protein